MKFAYVSLDPFFIHLECSTITVMDSLSKSREDWKDLEDMVQW
jgi:hypothetical protein